MASNLQHILPFEESGNFQSNNLVVFLHGFPDTTALWHSIVDKVNDDAFILNFSYPNFSEKSSKIFGHSQVEVAHRVKQIIDVYQNIIKREITLVAHDWGAVIAYIFDNQNPGVAKQLITLDVGPSLQNYALFNKHKHLNIILIHYNSDNNPEVMKQVLGYQLKLVLAYFIGLFLPFIGEWITKSVVTNYFQYKPPHLQRINSKWNYFYVYGILNRILSIISPQYDYLYGYKATTPIVFIYGEKKPYHFHTQQWLDHLQNTKGSEVHGADCGHWITESKEDFVTSIIKRRLVTLK